jgi:hypothetical protein
MWLCSIKLLTAELRPLSGDLNRNGRLRMWVVIAFISSPTHLLPRGYFSQHHVDTLNPTMSPVQFLASKFPGKTEQEYRGHLGNFQISGMTGCANLSWFACSVLRKITGSSLLAHFLVGRSLVSHLLPYHCKILIYCCWTRRVHSSRYECSLLFQSAN